jgi:MOSC domain-containing protein YiiM
MKIISVCTGTAQPQPAKSGLTGHFKREITGSVMITSNGLEGDTIVDTKHHGGIDQAVYIFGDTDRIWWENSLGKPLHAGFFGENLLISDLASGDLSLGDQLICRDVALQITSPRIPCATWAAHIGTPHAVKYFFAAKRPGAYARVLKSGSVSAKDVIEHRPFDGPKVSIQEAFAMTRIKSKPLDYLQRVANTPAHFKMIRDAKAALDG